MCGRSKARRLRASEVTLGKSLARSLTFEEAVAKFLEAAEVRNKPRTVRDYDRLLNRHFVPRFRKEQINQISSREIVKRLDNLSDTPSEQQHALSAIRALFNFAVRQHMVEQSPCAAMRPLTRATTRERVLDDWELVLVWLAASATGYPFGPIVQLLILTGQRRGEIAALKWDWIDRKERTITLPASLTKNRRQHVFPFADRTEALIASLPILGEYLFPAQVETARGKPTTVFNGWGKCKGRLDGLVTQSNKGEALRPWTLHDLRRTFTTNLAALGTAPHVTEKLINHASGTISGVAAVYNRFQYMDEMRAALTKWDAHFLERGFSSLVENE